MDTEDLFVTLSLFCAGLAGLVFFLRSGKRLKKMKVDLDEIGKTLAEHKPEDEKKK